MRKDIGKSLLSSWGHQQDLHLTMVLSTAPLFLVAIFTAVANERTRKSASRALGAKEKHVVNLFSPRFRSALWEHRRHRCGTSLAPHGKKLILKTSGRARRGFLSSSALRAFVRDGICVLGAPSAAKTENLSPARHQTGAPVPQIVVQNMTKPIPSTLTPTGSRTSLDRRGRFCVHRQYWLGKDHPAFPDRRHKQADVRQGPVRGKTLCARKTSWNTCCSRAGFMFSSRFCP
jgi:hypothetical protein